MADGKMFSIQTMEKDLGIEKAKSPRSYIRK